MSNAQRLKTKQELYQCDKNNIDNDITFQLKKYGLRQKHLLYYGDYNINAIRWSIRRKFKEFLIFLENVHELYLPYNADKPNFVILEYDKLMYDKNDVGFYAKEYSRIKNWLLIACEEIPYLKNYINKNSSQNGMNSPHNKVNIWILTQLGSPYKTELILKKINKHSYNLLQLLGFEHLYPNQRIVNDIIKYKISTNFGQQSYYFNRSDFLDIAIRTVFSTYFTNNVLNYMYPNLYNSFDEQYLKPNDNKEIIISKILGEYLLQNNKQFYTDIIFTHEENIEIAMFLSSLRNNKSNNFMQYLLQII